MDIQWRKGWPRIYEAMTTKDMIRVVMMVVLVLMEMMNEHQLMIGKRVGC